MDEVLKRPIAGDNRVVPGVVQGSEGLKDLNHYLRIQAHYIEWLNSFDVEPKFTARDAWPEECQVLSVTTSKWAWEAFEVWVLTWGTGDEGGPTFLIATFTAFGGGLWELQSITQRFDLTDATVMANGKLEHNA